MKTLAPAWIPVLLLALTTGACKPEPQAVAPPPKQLFTQGPLIEALSEPDSFKRIHKLTLLLPILGDEAVPAIRDALEDPSVDIGAAEIDLLTRAWAMHDPRAAMDYASLKPPIGLRLAALIPAAEEWARRDPQAALKGVATLMLIPTMNTKALQVGLVRGWFDSDQPGLAEYLKGLPMGFERQRMLGVFARRMIQRQGVEPLMRWVEALPEEPEDLRREAFRAAATELARHDPAAGVAFCEAHCGGPFGSKIMLAVGTRYAAHDGPAALQWLSTQPAGRARDSAVIEAYRRWIQRDADAAYAWAAAIGRENAEPWFGPVAEMYAMRISWNEPAEAMEWVALVGDEERREQAYITIARRWREKDEKASDAWVDQSPLSEEARIEARKLPERMQLPRHRKAKAEAAAKEQAEAGEQTEEVEDQGEEIR
jgi:hypothetical protein